MEEEKSFAAFLRGINISGKNKIPMTELKKGFEKLELEGVKTYLNSGNVVFSSEELEDILDTPVSPELLPAVGGQIAQKTEDLVGPYELHDFFLYYAIRWAFPPRKVLRLAEHAFGRSYDRATILKWLRTFYRRFFAQQFKRSCLPDGPKVGSVTLSPRGDWRMPSDAVASLWLEELEGLE